MLSSKRTENCKTKRIGTKNFAVVDSDLLSSITALKLLLFCSSVYKASFCVLFVESSADANISGSH